HDLDLGMAPRELLAHDRVAGPAAFLRDRDDAVELGAELEREGRGSFAALVAEQRHRDGPTAVDLTDDVVLRAARVGEEHFVELRVARDHPDRANLDA